MILAPLTRGGNLPYRRLCADLGCDISMSEMVYARSLLKGCPVERARLRRADNEKCFGVQIATNNVEEGVAAMQMIQQHAHKYNSPVDFIDLNCGCPIHEATRRGLGSSLLRSPKKLGRLVNGIVSSTTGTGIPLTVKIRLGCEDDTINVDEVVEVLRDAGAAAVSIHGRTAQNRYSKPCNWSMIQNVVTENNKASQSLPIIGNGDILTHHDAQRRMGQSGVDAVMVGRGALTKPWIFKEHKDGASWNIDSAERIAIYRTLALHMKDHFGNDAQGKKKSWNFLPWHFEFLCRYEPHLESNQSYSSSTFDDDDDVPLIQRRTDTARHDMDPLERLLSCRNKATHERIAERLWESSSDADALRTIAAFAESDEFKRIQASSEDENASAEVEELANIPQNKRRNRNDDRRRGRDPKPKRTPEEIRIVRAERAAKKAALLAEMENGSGGDDDKDAFSGPLKDERGMIKRWITSGRTGQFGFIGMDGVKGEYIVHEEALDDGMLPMDEDSLPIAITFDTEVSEDESKSERAVNVRLTSS